MLLSHFIGKTENRSSLVMEMLTLRRSLIPKSLETLSSDSTHLFHPFMFHGLRLWVCVIKTGGRRKSENIMNFDPLTVL
jgi:hypothetical protein